MRIECARRLVQQQQPRLAGECPGDADALLLTARDSVGARPDQRVVAIWPADDVVMDTRKPGRPLDRGIVEVSEEADVPGNGGVQQARLLRHVGNLCVPVLV
jgi:hypothetical protein